MSHSQPLPNPANVKQLVADAFSVLEQPTPPTLREILSAYRAKGDGDRDMLLAMLNAKTAEDQPEHFPRKRQRSSMSPPSPRGYDNSQYEQLPPSPYSSSGRSDSAEYSPRSRASMAIGSLLSTGPNQEMNTEDP
ncbi:hypothetical protein H0H81_005541 [Sphagnurus paluster]|uniref:Uncharacterized protein n=1 Tax=Sphagnurus paluster TaxID=117069 RepID=A0A9P7GLM0_9AGAR|nr:hypothetical protein H0H81_005541 [Sphagnurus paluster]